jgi:uncharacterized protein
LPSHPFPAGWNSASPGARPYEIRRGIADFDEDASTAPGEKEKMMHDDAKFRGHIQKRFGFILILAIIVPLISCSSAGNKSSLQKDSGLRIIDAHTHLVFNGQKEKTSGIVQSKEEFLRAMEANNVAGAVAHTGYLGDYHGDMRSSNVLFCYGIGEKIDTRQLEENLSSGKYGCIKIYLGYIHRYAYDEAYRAVYSLAGKYDVPVVFHSGDTYAQKAKLKYADPMTIDEVAVDNPGVRFVIAHCGNPWIKTAAEVAYKNPNVFLDLSGFLIGDLDKLSAADLDTYMIMPIKWIYNYIGNPSKILFGTDWPLVDMGSYIRVVKTAIPEENWPDVFYGNAVRVFKIKIKDR